jgi:hypothetical protein
MGMRAFGSRIGRPAGFRHYVADHEIRPSVAFESFIRNWHQ